MVLSWRAVLPSRRLSPQYGQKKRRYLPYNHQHLYFFLSEYLLALWGGNVVGPNLIPAAFLRTPSHLLPWLSSLFPPLPRVPLPLKVRVFWSPRVFCNCLYHRDWVDSRTEMCKAGS